MSTYDNYKKLISEDKEKALSGCRDGTKELLAKSVEKEPEGPKANVQRLVFIVFAILGLNSAISQLIIAFKWIKDLPGVSIIIFIKEFFGFVFAIKPAISILKQKPEVRVFEKLIDPFSEGNLLSGVSMPTEAKKFVKAFIYTIGSLSNLKAVLSNMIAARWNVNIPHLQQEAELQKIGNLMFLVFDLVVKTNNESLAVNIWLFKDLIIAIFFLVYAHVGRFISMSQVYDWMADISDRKLGKEGIDLGLESFYQMTNGEKPQTSFISEVLGYDVKAHEDKPKEENIEEKPKTE